MSDAKIAHIQSLTNDLLSDICDPQFWSNVIVGFLLSKCLEKTCDLLIETGSK